MPGSFFLSSQEPVSKSILTGLLQDRDYVLVGESHGNACDHKVQARVVEMLAGSGLNPAIGLEMVSVERQHVLDDFNAGRISISRMRDDLDWDGTWGHDFDLYRPVFETARKLDIPVLALNLPGHVTRSISRQGLGSLTREQAKYLPEMIIDPPAEQLRMLRQQFSLHQDLINSDQAKFKRFIAAQSAWDTMMAREAVGISRQGNNPVIILAGTGHVDRGKGIAHRLRVLDPQADIAAIVPVRSVKDISADDQYYYYCPPSRPRMRLGIVATMDNDKVIVRGVVPESLAMKVGLKKGDVILRAGQGDVASLADLHQAAVDALNNDQELRLEVLRQGRRKSFLISM